jgi:hypothetical protein
VGACRTVDRQLPSLRPTEDFYRVRGNEAERSSSVVSKTNNPERLVGQSQQGRKEKIKLTLKKGAKHE